MPGHVDFGAAPTSTNRSRGAFRRIVAQAIVAVRNTVRRWALTTVMFIIDFDSHRYQNFAAGQEA